MKVIILVGLALSGKTTYAKVIGPKYNMPLYETGAEVLDEVTQRGLQFTPENIKLVTDECKKISDSYFTERLIKKVEKLPKDIPGVNLSGIRAESEVEVLKKHFGDDNVFIIAFHASIKTRYRRLSNLDRIAETRGAKAEEDKILQDFDNFLARNRKELGYGVGNVIANADYVISTENERWPYSSIDNNTKEFETCVREILELK